MSLRNNFKLIIRHQLKDTLKYSSIMQVPRLEKIVINIGAGDAAADPKLLDSSVSELNQITGQKPIITKAKKSIAAFKLREGLAIGCVTTLRNNEMYDFYEKLINVVLPRIRDFNGVNPKSFDGRGNYTLGIKEQLIFPEIEYEKIAKVRGMDIIFVTSAKTNEEAYALLTALGMPFSDMRKHNKHINKEKTE